MFKIKNFFLIVKSVVFYTSTLFLWPLLILSFGIFITYRKMVDIFLRQNLGKKYGGLLDVADSIMITNDRCKYTISSILIVKSNVERDMFQIVREKLENKIFSSSHHYPKLTSTQHVFGGYPYWKKNNYTLDDCLRLMYVSDDKEFNEEYLREITTKLISKPFPKNDTGLWEVVVSQKPLKYNENDGFFYYPIVIRLSHAIGDGTSLFAFLIHVIGDTNVKNYNEEIFAKLFHQSPKNNTDSTVYQKLLLFWKNMVTFLELCFYIVFIGLGKAIINALKADDKNALHGPELCGEKLIAWHAEDNIQHIPIAKRTKNRVPNTKFSHVIMTAISASLTNFFFRNDKPIPENITTILTVLLRFPMYDSSEHIELENKTTVLVFELPANKSNSLSELLEKIKEKTKEVKYGDLLVHDFFITRFAGILPIGITKKIVGRGPQTTLISNLPGGSQVSSLDGCVLYKIISWAPNLRKVGVSISIFSYDDRFQLGILVDKAIISSQQEVQRIADDIFDYIKLLDMETRELYHDN